MLFVDNREAECLEGNALLNERMRADNKLSLAGRGSGERGGLFRGFEAAGKAHDFYAERLKPAGDFLQMLVGENFRRRH